MGIRRGLVALSLVVGLGACGAPGGDPEVTPTGVGPTDRLTAKTADDLSRTYLTCVNAAGFTLKHVSVHDLAGTGIMVKTEVDVPAPVHAPCLELIGGLPTVRSSWSL